MYKKVSFEWVEKETAWLNEIYIYDSRIVGSNPSQVVQNDLVQDNNYMHY